jgi:hypothetical protein
MVGWHAGRGAVGTSQLSHGDAGVESYTLIYSAITYPLIAGALHLVHLDAVARTWGPWACWVPTLLLVETYRRWWRHQL